MNERIVQELKGNSGCQVLLMEDDYKPFVRKTGDIDRNLERYKDLRNQNIQIPLIYNVESSYYDMEYINGLDIKSYLLMGHSSTELISFIRYVVTTLASYGRPKDYTQTYIDKLELADFSGVKFNPGDLIDRLPKVLMQTPYHGDFTLENILYDVNRMKFVAIDPLTSVYDSVIFDMAKLRQDLVCKWFIRTSPNMLGSKLDQIYNSLADETSFQDPYLLILMLLRVLPYSQNDFDKNYLIDGINKLWK